MSEELADLPSFALTSIKVYLYPLVARAAEKRKLQKAAELVQQDARQLQYDFPTVEFVARMYPRDSTTYARITVNEEHRHAVSFGPRSKTDLKDKIRELLGEQLQEEE